MKHIRKFKSFEYATGPKVKKWSHNDQIITLYYHKFGFNKLGVQDEEKFIAEYLGATIDSLTMQSLNIKELLSKYTNGDKGLPHVSKAQIDVVDKYHDYSEDELRVKVEEILDNTTDDDILDNLIIYEERKNHEEQEQEKKLKKAREEEEENRIKNKYGKNLKNISDIETNDNIPYISGDIINHFKFGEGEIISIDGKIIEAEFDGDTKKVLYKPEFFK